MPKGTGYHPVSLHVIRGAFEYCGIKVGRIHQTRSDRTSGTARYTVKIGSLPDSIRSLSTGKILKHLDDCFGADIHVMWVMQTNYADGSPFSLLIGLLVDIYPDTPMEAEIRQKAMQENDPIDPRCKECGHLLDSNDGLCTNQECQNYLPF